MCECLEIKFQLRETRVNTLKNTLFLNLIKVYPIVKNK